MTRLHIRSGGSYVDTVVTTDDGQEIDNVVAVEWKVAVPNGTESPYGLGVAVITVNLVDLDVAGEP